MPVLDVVRLQLQGGVDYLLERVKRPLENIKSVVQGCGHCIAQFCECDTGSRQGSCQGLGIDRLFHFFHGHLPNGYRRGFPVLMQ